MAMEEFHTFFSPGRAMIFFLHSYQINSIVDVPQVPPIWELSGTHIGIYSPNACNIQDYMGRELRAMNLIQVSHGGWKDSVTWAVAASA